MVPEIVAELFRSTYGSDPEVIASAPGRVNLIGEHLDYNGGEVLPMAISSRTWVAMRRNQRSSSRIVSSTEDGTGMFESPTGRRSGRWWDYVSGLGSLTGKALPSVDVAVASTVPSRAGLSSSAALEVASGCAYAALDDAPVSLRDVALDGWRVETQFVGVASGIMDQFASALSLPGHALHVWCDTTETENVPFARTVLIFDTRAERSLRNSDFNLRRSECTGAFELLRARNPTLGSLASATRDEVDAARLPDLLRQRAWHVVTEMERVHAAVEQLRAGGTVDPELLYESHRSLRDQYQCSSPELDWFVDRAGRADGVEGARLTGAGWGGCAIAFGTRQALEAAGQEIAKEYETAFNLEPRFWLSDASEGARIELR